MSQIISVARHTDDLIQFPMTYETSVVGNTTLMLYPDNGSVLTSPDDALCVIGDAWSVQATHVALPIASRPQFFDLSTLFAGEFLQKFVNYRMGLTIVGDISAYTQLSSALQAFVTESNRGHHIWFLPTVPDLTNKLT